MKKIILSAAVAAMAFSTSAFAADKGIDIDVSGQAVFYYETHSDNGTGDKGQLDQANSTASAGIQLNLGSDLGNNFTFGSQITYLSGLGLTKDAVNGAKQNTTGGTAVGTDTTTQLALTKMFIAKQIGNTTLKAGRQELPKSLSPLAFSEGWTVFKNTFDAIIAINTDLPKTTLVGAFVSGGTGLTLGSVSDLTPRSDQAGAPGVAGAAYMITVQTKLIPMSTLTVSYYAVQGWADSLAGVDGIDVTAIWADLVVAPKDAPLGLKVSLQGGQISPDSFSAASLANAGGIDQTDDTNAFGAKIDGKAGAISFKAIYTTVDGSDNKTNPAVVNVGTGTKSPLYSQMTYNQKLISLESDTIVLGVGYDAGSIGKFAANYGMTNVKAGNYAGVNTTGKELDYNELDLVYKIKTGGVQYFATAVIRDWDTGLTPNTTTTLNAGATDDTVIRFWARYNF